MTINAISFNIRYCDDADGNTICERAPRLKKVISKYDADVIGFQECTPPWEPILQDYYSAEYDIFGKHRGEDDVESAQILWRKDKFDCIKTGYFWLSDTPDVPTREWDELCHCYRICIYAILEDRRDGKRFVVMNTHFGFGDKGQIKSVELVYDYSIKISPYPTFVLGDFNMKPDSAGYAAMTAHFTDANVARDLSPTFHGYFREKAKPAHIDYCFVDQNVIPVDQKIIDDLVDGKCPSDHYGLSITLQI